MSILGICRSRGLLGVEVQVYGDNWYRRYCLWMGWQELTKGMQHQFCLISRVIKLRPFIRDARENRMHKQIYHCCLTKESNWNKIIKSCPDTFTYSISRTNASVADRITFFDQHQKAFMSRDLTARTHTHTRIYVYIHIQRERGNTWIE